MRPILSLAALSLFLASAATARPAAPPNPVHPETPTDGMLVGTPLTLPVAPGDTVSFGGTAWDPVNMRWEAIRDSVWTFESGVGSAINTDPDLKAVGLHSLLEGWTGLDLTELAPGRYFRRSDQCAIDGSWSLWAGVTQAEAESLGYVSGQGYGNNWNMGIGKTFSYPGSGNVTLRFDYAVETEDGFDFLHVLVDTTGDLSANPALVTSYTGTVSGSDSLTLTPGISLPSAPGPVTLIFLATSDVTWSDEDGNGMFNSICGHSAVDDIILTGALSDTSDLESGDQGWTFIKVPSDLEGRDWTDIRAVSDLDRDPAIACTGVFGDSALTFIDSRIAGGGHGRRQNNLAVSPWIDLSAPDLAQKVARGLEFTGYADVNDADLILYSVYVQWLPADLPSPKGTGETHGLHLARNLFPGHACTTRPDWMRVDLTQDIPPEAQQVRIAIGIQNVCNSYYFCTGQTNQSPWFDDVRFTVSDGSLVQPLRAILTDLPRDAFPEPDVNTDLLHRTARFDSNYPGPNSGLGTLGDTLVVFTDRDYNGSRVDVVFRVTPGPGIDTGRLGTWLSGFADEGNGWVSGRMDTAEVGGSVIPGRWMTAFHEEDPNFRLTDRAHDAGDLPPNGKLTRLANDMFPDDLFTPGTRVDLFYRWTLEGYPGQMSLLPDTTGGHYLEMEVLPSSISPDGGANNSILFVNQTRKPEMRAAMERALAILRPGTSTNAEGTTWDRYDIPSAGPMIPGYASDKTKEHDVDVLGRYDIIIWGFEGINISALLWDDSGDAGRLTEWLKCFHGQPGAESWGCGHGLYLAGESFTGTNSNFYKYLGVDWICAAVNGCVTQNFSETCIQVTGSTASPHFGDNAAWHLHSNYDADLLTPRPSDLDGDHRVNLLYQTPYETDVQAASVSTVQIMRNGTIPTGYWRSVYDAFPPYLLSNSETCDTTQSAVNERLGAVLDWFQSSGPTPVDLLTVSVARNGDGVRLTWRVADDRGDLAGFHVYRQLPGAERKRINPVLLTPRSDYAFTDPQPPAGNVEYWLLELSRDGTTTWHGPYTPEGAAPVRFRVLQSRPNPFSGSTRIRLELPVAAPVLVQIFALSGRLVATLHEGPLAAGEHDLEWDGRDADGRPAAAGIYFDLVRTPEHRVVRKLVKVDGR